MKLIQLLYDLVLNDDSIVDDGFYVRDTLGENKELVEYLIGTVRDANIQAWPET